MTAHTATAQTAPADQSHPTDPTDQTHQTQPTRAHCCRGANAQGQPCRSPARPGSDYCFRHDPERAPAPPTPEVEPPNFQLSGPVTDAGALRELLGQVIHYAATSPAPDLKRVHAISALAGPLLRTFQKQEVEQDLAAARAELRALQEAHARALTELATVRESKAPPSVHELADTRQRAAQAEAALAAARDQRRELEDDLLQAQDELEMVNSRLASEVEQREQLTTALKDTTLVDRLCLTCIRTLRNRHILGPPAHEDDPDWPRRR